MAQSNTSITSAPAPIVPEDPQVPGAAEAFFKDFRLAMDDYPEEFVTLEIVQVEFPGSFINQGEEGNFMVQLTNNGALDMTDVTLKVQGLSGTLVKTGGAADFDFRQDLTITMESDTIAGGGGVSLTNGSKLKFLAPPGTKPAGTQLLKATIFNWNGSLSRLLNVHSHREEIAPTGTYSNQVVGE